jgi:integrase
MAQEVNKLSARTVATLTTAGRHSDGGGLYLNVTPSGARSWIFMWKLHGKRREMGLGNARDVSLAKARELASEARKQIIEGIDPLALKNASKPRLMTFGEAADALIESKGSEWRNAKHKAQWEMTLREYAKSIRSRPVADIDTADVLKVLKPHWQKRPETASRLRGRMERVLDYAKAQGMRLGENPARWRGHLDAVLPKRQMLTRGHHKALSFEDMPAFMTALRGVGGVSARALEFCILTASRTSEALEARWDELNIKDKVWIIPAKRMKAGREHRVPLCERAMAIVDDMSGARVNDYVFAGLKKDKPLSNMALAMVMRRMEAEERFKSDGATVHGFRSSFRDWAGERTHFPREVAEAALAHTLRDKTEAAYRRGDALEKRRKLMDAWANYCEPKDAKVITLRA